MLEKIIRKYYNAIFGYCYRSVGNRSTAEDLCQDTFASFIEHYADCRNAGKIKYYFYTITRNKCTDYFRKKTPVLWRKFQRKKRGSMNPVRHCCCLRQSLERID